MELSCNNISHRVNDSACYLNSDMVVNEISFQKLIKENISGPRIVRILKLDLANAVHFQALSTSQPASGQATADDAWRQRLNSAEMTRKQVSDDVVRRW